MLTASLTTLATDAGDSGVLLPVALVSGAMLWRLHSRRLAWMLLRSVALAGAVIAALKLLFLSCLLHGIPDLTSPSGHACMSVVVYGAVATLAARGRPRWLQALIAVVALLLVALIAATRLMLGVHSRTEVLVGLAVGAVALAWFARSYARVPPLRMDAAVFGVAVLATVLLAFGVRLPAESFLRHLAKRMGDVCALVADGSAAPPAALLPQPERNTARTSSASARAVWS